MRRKPVVLRARADADIDSALDHYLLEAPRVVDRLLAALEKAITAIENHPAAGSARYAMALGIPGLRHRPVSKLPYLVFYLEGPKDVSVLRVLHVTRDVPADFEPE